MRNIKQDAKRYCKKQRINIIDLIILYIRHFSFRIILQIRLYHYIKNNKSLLIKGIRPFLLLIIKIISKYSQRTTGILISLDQEISGGLKFEHYGGIVINCRHIGKHCTIFQNVTIGYAGRPGKGGSPTIGDNVVIGAGAVIVGPIKIGNNVFIGANACIFNDIPDNAVVGAAPGNIISFKGTKGYFEN